MQKLLPLLILTILLPLTSSGQTSTDSVKVSVTDIRTINGVIEKYQGCQLLNNLLNKQVDDCTAYQSQSQQTLAEVRILLAAKDRQINDADSVIGLQRQQVSNIKNTLKLNRKIALRETIGYTIGGFAIGVSVPLIIYFIKH